MFHVTARLPVTATASLLYLFKTIVSIPWHHGEQKIRGRKMGFYVYVVAVA